MSTGIIRRIDELGRKSLRIKNGDNLEIFVDAECIMLKKYSQIENVIDMVSMYAESFHQVLRYNVIVTDTDKIVACAGDLSKKYLNHEISNSLTEMIERRNNFIQRKKDSLEIIPEVFEQGYYAIATIITNGDSIGSVIILSLDSPMLEQEEKLAKILANILSNYFV